MRLLLFFLFTAIATAQETLIRKQTDATTDTHVEVTSLFSRPSADGYFPVRVKIANNLDRTESIRLDFRSSANYDNSLRCSSSFTFEAPPGKTVTRDIVVPQNPIGTNYNGTTTIECELSGSMGLASHSVSAEYYGGQPSVLLSEPLFTPNASKLDSEISTRISPSYGRSSLTFGSRFNAGMLPDNWLAYSGFDRILMKDSDWTSAPAGARSAIGSWVKLGGDLIIYTTSETTLQALALPDDTGFGTVKLKKVNPRAISSDDTIALDASDTVDEIMGSGLTAPRKESLEKDFQHSWPLRNTFGDESFRYAFFIIILVIFGILVGPINLFVFAKSGRRHRLFITTPIISLGASVLLILLIIFQDGFGGRGMRTALVEINDNMAYVQQEQFCRTGVLTKSSFTIDPAVLITPTQLKETPWSRYTPMNAKGSFNLQPSGGKLSATGDWFQSRSETGHVIAGAIPTRGRIERSPSDGKLVSTFDFPVEKLFYCDLSGNWFRADKITTGNPFSLAPVSETMIKPEIDELSGKLSVRNQYFFERIRDRKGHFIAFTKSGPVVETHPGIRWKETTTILTGAVVAP